MVTLAQVLAAVHLAAVALNAVRNGDLDRSAEILSELAQAQPAHVSGARDG